MERNKQHSDSTKIQRRIRTGLGISLSITLLSCLVLVFLPKAYMPFELKTYDLRMQLRKDLPQLKRILFIEMDSAALSELGRWPWPRITFARIVKVLRELGARQIVFDVTFTEPGQLIIDKDKLREGLGLEEGNRLIQDFLKNLTEELDKTQNVDPQLWKGYLAQIQEGMGTITQKAQETLQEATLDYDQVFAQEVKAAGNVLLGYKFEVLHEPKDMQRTLQYQKIKVRWLAFLAKNPCAHYQNLPRKLRHWNSFSDSELELMFRRMRVLNLLKANIQLSLAEVSRRLEEDPNFLHPHFNDLKIELIDEKIDSFLTQTKNSDFQGFIWKEAITDSETVELCKERYPQVKLKSFFREKFSLPFSKPPSHQGLWAVEAWPPIAALAESARNGGYLNAIPDEDGVLRKVPLLVRYKNKVFPHISLASILDLSECPSGKLNISPKGELVLECVQPPLKIPLDPDGYMLINWADHWQDSFEHLSATEVYRLWLLENNIAYNSTLSKEELRTGGLEKKLEEDILALQEAKAHLGPLIKDHVCIIGLTAPGTHDYNPIPLQPDYPMVGTHANVINTVLNRLFITRLGLLPRLCLLILFGAFIGFLLPRFSPLRGLALMLAIIALYTTLAFFFFSKGVWIDMVAPLAVVILSYTAVSTYNFASSEKEKRWIRNAFSHYVSKNVMEEILRDPNKLKLGGERKILTVLFSDIRGFTHYSENRQPEEVVSILNEFLDEMTKIILKNNGTLDKYVGDEIMAVFGAPSAYIQEDHAQRAVLTAIQMRERLKELQEKWRKEGKEALEMGIGINTGPMVVGNMGSTEMMDYTVIGDAVNLGARLEAITREYNYPIIISEFTYEFIKGQFLTEKIEAIKVKGKEKPVLIYAVLGRMP